MTYTGLDNCGNSLTYQKVITVMPDTQAPYGDSIGLEITLDFNAETPHPDSIEMVFYKDSIGSKGMSTILSSSSHDYMYTRTISVQKKCQLYRPVLDICIYWDSISLKEMTTLLSSSRIK